MKIMIKMAVVLMAIILSGCKVEVPQNQDNQPDPGSDKHQQIELKEIQGVSPHAYAGQEMRVALRVVDDEGNESMIDEGFKISASSTMAHIEDQAIFINETVLTGDLVEIVVEWKGLTEITTIMIVNFLDKTIDENNVITNYTAYDSVVNKQRNLPANYEPEDLVTVEVPTCLPNPEIRQLRQKASDALTEMFKAAEDDGIRLVARSGYRSYQTQKALYSNYVAQHGQENADRFSAAPGQSEHQTGLAMDVTAESVGLQLDEKFGDTLEGQWVAQNSHHYGFIIRYPEGMESITGYLYEPWHLRYLGNPLATLVYESGLTLEEYLESFESIREQ